MVTVARIDTDQNVVLRGNARFIVQDVNGNDLFAFGQTSDTVITFWVANPERTGLVVWKTIKVPLFSGERIVEAAHDTRYDLRDSPMYIDGIRVDPTKMVVVED